MVFYFFAWAGFQGMRTQKTTRFYHPYYQKLQLQEKCATGAELSWNLMALTHLITNKKVTVCEIMETGRYSCLCQAEQPLNFVLHKTFCKCSFLVWIPVAPRVTKTRRKQSDHCHTYLYQHSASEECGTGSCSFPWKVKFQSFLLNKGFTRTLQQPPYLQCQRLPPHILQKGRSRNQGILRTLFQG